MSKFPDPIPLPNEIPFERLERRTNLTRSATIGILIRSSIIAVELIGVVVFQSASLFLDAMSSLFDVAASLLLIVFIKLAARPPDKEHPFGHGRYEPIAGLQLSILLILVGGGLLLSQGLQLIQDTASTAPALNKNAWLIPFCAVILLEISYQTVMRVAKRNQSPALAADALHYRIDSLNSLLAAIVLLVGRFFPDWSAPLDHLGAVLIAALMVGIGIYSTRNNLNQLMDRIPDPQFFTRVCQAAKRVPGVLGTEKVRIQLYGPDAHVDIDIEVDPLLSVYVAHEISQKTRVEIQKDWPAVRDVTVHIEPYYPNDHE